MNPKVLLGVGLLGVTLAGTAILLAAGRAPSVLDRLRALPEDFAAAYRQREAELRAALIPDDDAVAAARADVAARRSSGRGFGAVPVGAHAARDGADAAPTGAHAGPTGAVSPAEAGDDVPYAF
ncbi:hypothetical protein KZX45_01525 [Georgenia sp. EYE_87]|uniref:hypothetical protein n=1 Tax=Georgenia sp. EYE_87 TaxID=2853448 RepID=UPI0020038282|nr:hypothetical protein [Georgenia sp. EYE_87]MCK6209224.1 hypothetical protein [Georgenia sp. EYE_87]